MITGFVNFRTVLDKLYRDLGINHEIPENDVVSWIGEALAMIGAYGQYEEISTCLTLTGGKAKLPCGFEKLVDINYKQNPMYWATNTNANNYQCHNCRIPNCTSGNSCNFTFYINNSYIITSINDTNATSEDSVCIVYLGIPTDEEGLPLIPDDIYYQKALTSYVISMIDYQDWRKGKLPDKIYQKSEQDWLFYVNSARGAANMPNVAQLENIKNVLRRLLPVTNDYKRGFKNFNKQENLSKGQ